MKSVLAFHRELVVDVPLGFAWHYFNDAVEWPKWAQYLKQVDLAPAGPIGPQTVATLHMHKGPNTIFTVKEFVPLQRWMWTTKALTCTLEYDHAFTAIGEKQTKISLHMTVSGLGKSLMARLVRAGSEKNLDIAIPLLIEQMNSAGAV